LHSVHCEIGSVFPSRVRSTGRGSLLGGIGRRSAGGGGKRQAVAACCGLSRPAAVCCGYEICKIPLVAEKSTMSVEPSARVRAEP
jgi:hypothetical protein